MKPTPHKTYTFEQVCNLDLLDSPCLLVDGVSPVQNSHFILEDLLDDEAWRNSRWVYLRTTSEWIPVFELIDGNPSDLCQREAVDYGLGSKEIVYTPITHPLGALLT